MSGYYDSHSRQVVSNRFHSPRSHETYIADQFAIEINLDALDSTGWPRVKEVGLRHQSIARRYGVPVEDLHFYRNGDACLGLAYPWDPLLTLENLVQGLVEPFFYRPSLCRHLWFDCGAERSVARVLTRRGRSSRALRGCTTILSVA